MARALLLFNPAAGNAPTSDQLRSIEQELELSGFDVEAAGSEGPGDLTRLACSAVDTGVERVVVCGGDGSIREAAKGLRAGAVPLAVVPLGTANVLSRELGLPAENFRACAVVAGTGKVRRIGMGLVEPDEVFTFSASAGIDAWAVHRIDAGEKRLWGGIAYMMASLREIFEHGAPNLAVETDAGERIEGFQVFVARARRYGQGWVMLSRRAHLASPSLHLFVLQRPILRTLALCVSSALGEGLEECPGVVHREVDALTILGDETSPPVQADGDVVARTPAHIRSLPDSLSVIVPR